MGRRRALAVLFGAVGLTGAFVVALPWLLIGEASPLKSDAILHLAMAPESDADSYVASLYEGGLAPAILCVSSSVTCDTYPADYAARHLADLGIPQNRISTLKLPRAECAAEHLPRILAHVRQQGWQSVLLVVRPVGSRFAAAAWRRSFETAGVRVAMAYSPRDRQEVVDGWWWNHRKAQDIVRAAVETALDGLYPECR